jgi:hypothetical protein
MANAVKSVKTVKTTDSPVVDSAPAVEIIEPTPAVESVSTPAVESAPAVSESEAIKNAIETDSPNVQPSPAEIIAHHDATVLKIAGMLKTKYAQSSIQAFEIGREMLDFAIWKKSTFPGFKGGDFDDAVNSIKTKVRLFVAIKPESIRVAHWCRAYVLRELVRELVGDSADAYTSHELINASSSAMTFDKAELVGTINQGWHEFFKTVTSDRNAFASSNGEKGDNVVGDGFDERIKSHADKVSKDRATALDPVKAAKDALIEASKVRRAKEAKSKKTIEDAVTKALSEELMGTSAVLALVETIAKDQGKAMPSHVGFNPATCTKADCDLLASTMFQTGKLAEMIHLRDRLSAMISAAENARLASQAGLTTEKRIGNADPAVNPLTRHAEKHESRVQAVA